MSIHEDIVNAAREGAESVKRTYCNKVCSKVSVVPKGTSGKLVDGRCQSCKEITDYVTYEIVMLMDSTDWDMIYGPKNMSMNQAKSYLASERRLYRSQIIAIKENAVEICNRQWGMSNKFNTALSNEERKNPIITGLNEFFEEENIRHREYMTAEVAPPDVLSKENRKCRQAIHEIFFMMMSSIKANVPRFDF